MANKKIQGQSAVTPEKQRLLGSVFKTQYNIVSHVLRKKGGLRNAVHIDINAGAGYDEEGNHGSPLIFLDVLQNIKTLPLVQCFFVEIDKKLHFQLKKAVNEHVTSLKSICKPKIILGDSKKVIYDIASECEDTEIWGSNFGTLYHDPNAKLELDLIVEFSKFAHLKQVDILLNINTVMLKRLLKCKARGMEKYMYDLRAAIKMIERRKFIIRTPLRPKNGENSKWDFCFLFCSNWVDYPAWEKENFYDLDSEEGQAILFSVNYTKAEKEKMTDSTSMKYKKIFEALLNKEQLNYNLKSQEINKGKNSGIQINLFS